MLRPWHSAGITHFLIDTEVSLSEDNTDEIAPHTPHFSDKITNRTIPTDKTPSASPPSYPKTEYQPHRPQEVHHALEKAPSQNGIDHTLPNIPLSQWPRNWSALYNKTKPATIVWSYPELGTDLTGNSDKARGAYLRSLIGALNLPKGSSTFWPLSLPDDTTDVQSGHFFQLGLQLLQPRAVLLFGKESIRQSGLSIPLTNPYTQTIIQGILYILLPDFPTLIPKKESVFITCTFLREILRTVPALFTS